MIQISNLSKSFYPRVSFSQFLRRSGLKQIDHAPGWCRVNALMNINLKVEAGCVFGLLGPNGAGKTTLLKILATLILPDGGTATLNGYDLTTQPAQIRASIGLASGDERSFYWRVSGRANLQFFGRLNNIPISEINRNISRLSDLLALAGLDRPVGEYSAGMRQKLNLARSLIADPPILLIDEPTKSLDIETSRRLRRFIREELARRQGKTILLVTHNLAEAEELCDQAVVLKSGQVVATGMVDKIKACLSGPE